MIGYVPPVPAAGVPERVAVPSPLSTKVTPLGRGPVSETAGAGKPPVVTVNVPALPVVKVVSAPELMDGGSSTVRVNDWLAAGSTPLRRRDGERVDATAARRGRPGQGGGAVTVVDEGHTAGEGSGLGEGGGGVG